MEVLGLKTRNGPGTYCQNRNTSDMRDVNKFKSGFRARIIVVVEVVKVGVVTGETGCGGLIFSVDHVTGLEETFWPVLVPRLDNADRSGVRGCVSCGVLMVVW